MMSLPSECDAWVFLCGNIESEIWGMLDMSSCGFKVHSKYFCCNSISICGQFEISGQGKLTTNACWITANPQELLRIRESPNRKTTNHSHVPDYSWDFWSSSDQSDFLKSSQVNLFIKQIMVHTPSSIAPGIVIIQLNQRTNYTLLIYDEVFTCFSCGCSSSRWYPWDGAGSTSN